MGLFGESILEKRERLFINKRQVFVKDDEGQLISPQPDWGEDTYGRIISTFTELEDHIFLPRISTGMINMN